MALHQNTREKAVKAFVIAGGHRVFWRADPQVMHPQMFRPEVAVQNCRQQQIGQPPLCPRLLMHQLMAVVDSNCPGNHPHAKEQRDLFQGSQMAGLRHIPDQRKQQDELDRKPDHGDDTIPEQARLGRAEVGIIGIQTRQRVNDRKHAPGIQRQQHNRPSPDDRAQDGNRNHAQRQPERQGVAQAFYLGGGNG